MHILKHCRLTVCCLALAAFSCGAAPMVKVEKAGAEKIMEAFAFATRLRDQGNTVTVQPLKKNAKFQVETLEKNGYTAIRKIYADTLLEDGI